MLMGGPRYRGPARFARQARAIPGRYGAVFMSAAPIEFTLELTPRARVDVIDVRGEVFSRYGDALDRYPRALCCSFHTTAGYLDQSVAARLNQNPAGVMPYIDRLPDDVPGRGGLRARQDRAADGAVARAAAVRAAERPLAPRVHGGGAAHVRRLPEPSRRADVVHRSRRRACGAAAHAAHERAWGIRRRRRSRRRAWSCPCRGTGSSRST